MFHLNDYFGATLLSVRRHIVNTLRQEIIVQIDSMRLYELGDFVSYHKHLLELAKVKIANLFETIKDEVLQCSIVRRAPRPSYRCNLPLPSGIFQ